MSGFSFKDFVRAMTELAGEGLEERRLAATAKPLLSDLLRSDHWLPTEFARPDPSRYTQNLLHCDPLERFSIVSFVWAPGQLTPIHDHTVWGLIGVLRGAEVAQRFVEDNGSLHPVGTPERLEVGDIDMVSPTVGDIHQVRNGWADLPSISIHIYGGNIGLIKRHAFEETGSRKTFISGYSLPVVPNIWAC